MYYLHHHHEKGTIDKQEELHSVCKLESLLENCHELEHVHLVRHQPFHLVVMTMVMMVVVLVVVVMMVVTNDDDHLIHIWYSFLPTISFHDKRQLQW